MSPPTRLGVHSARSIHAGAALALVVRAIGGITIAGIAFLTGVAGCAKPPPPVVPEPIAKPVPPVAVVGEWTWAWDSTVDDVARIETEHWSLAGDPTEPTKLSATLHRQVTFQVQSGQPFRCSQSRQFTVTTRFVFQGTRGPKDALLRETERTRMPSPCAPDTATVAPLTVTLAPTRGGLTATSNGRVQSLRSAALRPDPPQLGIADRWAWQTTTELDARTIEVREDWTLERRDTELAGQIERTFTITAKNGLTLDCAGASTATYSETFAITGRIEVRAVTIVETARTSVRHPCSAGETVRLDTARGVLFPKHLELRWRGHRRQVLHRRKAGSTPFKQP